MHVTIQSLYDLIPGFVRYENQPLDKEFHATMNRFVGYVERQSNIEAAKALLAQAGFGVLHPDEVAAAAAAASPAPAADPATTLPPPPPAPAVDATQV